MNCQDMIWETIIGFTSYEVSNSGLIRNLKNKHICKQRLDKYGYFTVQIYNDNKVLKTKLVHRLVAIAFIPNPKNKPQVNHKKGIKIDNRFTELEWATCSENVKHAFDIGLKFISEDNKEKMKAGSVKKLSKPVIQKTLEGCIVKKYKSQSYASKETGISQAHISKSIHGKRNHAGGYIWE